MLGTPPHATGTLHPHFGPACPPPAQIRLTLLWDSRRSADELSSSDSTDPFPTSRPRPRSGIQINSRAKGNWECAPSPAVAPPPRALAAAIEIAACRDMLAAVAGAPVIDVRAAAGAHVRRMLPLHVRVAPAARRGRRRASAATVSGRVALAAPCGSGAAVACRRRAARAAAVVVAERRRRVGASHTRRAAHGVVREARRSGVCGQYVHGSVLVCDVCSVA